MPQMMGYFENDNLFDPETVDWGAAWHHQARVLGDFLDAYAVAHRVSIRPTKGDELGADEGKYFNILDAQANSMAIVDIHVHRPEGDFCPKQDVMTPLLPTDRLYMISVEDKYPLAC